MAKHRHHFKPFATTGSNTSPKVLYRCSCGEKREQRASPAMKHLLQQEEETVCAQHQVWHDFKATFYPNFKWKLTGYALMQAVDEWASKYTKDVVRVLSIDDEGFSSSSLVLIEHKTDSHYMGTTVIVIPQNFGSPCIFFLYPCDRDPLIKALTAIRKAAVAIKPREMEAQEAHRLVWKAETYSGE